MTASSRFAIYRSRRLTVRGLKTEWRWRLVAANGKIIATGGGDGFRNYDDLLASIALVKSSAFAPIVGERPK